MTVLVDSQVSDHCPWATCFIIDQFKYGRKNKTALAVDLSFCFGSKKNKKKEKDNPCTNRSNFIKVGCKGV